jgi:hypothetical protein
MKNIVRFPLFVNADLKGNFPSLNTVQTAPPYSSQSHGAPLPAPRLAVAFKTETDMQDMYGLAILFELSQKQNGRRKHEFEHLRETGPLRAGLLRLWRRLRPLRNTKGPE